MVLTASTVAPLVVGAHGRNAGPMQTMVPTVTMKSYRISPKATSIRILMVFHMTCCDQREPKRDKIIFVLFSFIMSPCLPNFSQHFLFIQFNRQRVLNIWLLLHSCPVQQKQTVKMLLIAWQLILCMLRDKQNKKKKSKLSVFDNCWQLQDVPLAKVTMQHSKGWF